MEAGWINDIWTYLSDAISSTQVTTISAILKLFISLLLGSAVGFERKRRGQIAGVRTFALISMGATLAMLLSIYIPQEYLGLKNGDPGRIAAQVITGIGFLGAGTIIQMKGSVRGLTTAAGIWMVATIGMAIGVGLYIIAFCATLFILFILVVFEKYEHKVNMGWETKVIKVEIKGVIQSVDKYRDFFKKHKLQLQDLFLRIDYEREITVINFIILSNSTADYIQIVKAMHECENTLSITITNEVNI